MKEGSILILKIMRNVIFICTIFASPVSGIAASALVSSSYSEIITDLPDSSGRRDFYLASGLAFQSPSEDQGHFVSWDFVG